ncbi:VOC family protein [Gordonia sp. TBRC 11910]|uniref:VOC family protein n=1 Tax=Gordonia asplenii TaxID=2725283 RepID=A0A848LAT8_9ACTN|nr:VOC family protein [Gordonia asplenii]NMO04688.1 VOC family protein [Gordonia asplenii]
MKYHHIAVFVSDAEESLKLYRDILGFKVVTDTIIPDRPEGTFFDQKTLDDIFKVEGSKSRMVLLAPPEVDGTFLEFQQPLNPPVQRKPKETLRYAHTGISELGFEVTDIDQWFEKVRSAGYETQTEYVWEAGGIVRSFLFYDPDGNMVQLCENLVDMKAAFA